MNLLKTIPALPIRDIEKATDFYQDRFGFTVGYRDDGFAIVTRDAVEVHLWAASDESWKGREPETTAQPIKSGAETFIAGTASCRIEVEDIDKLYEEFKRSGVLYNTNTIVESKPWGTREFPALDQDRNLITFYQRQ